ncbi:unnamed protein product [Peronospora destructor]|uniref:Arb2 domain-containing protein n=1 Tax=Peronospora destructor TaxID=86335 RepID=A0AAV0UT06_9STRA|nr:unnamed protein product [Peronospora destructor]
MPSPHRTQSGRHGSFGRANQCTSAEDSCVFVDKLIRGVQLRLHKELGFREVVIATGQEASDVDTDSSGAHNSVESPGVVDTHNMQSWEASKCQLLYNKAVDRQNSDTSQCSECVQGTVYVSDGYEKKQRLLVIVPYREAGIWSRSICMNQFDSDSDSGSMMSYLKKALRENYGVVIFNPAAQSCHPRAHVENAWDQLIAPLLK